MDRTICIFGDSITWGAGDEYGVGWADRLKAQYAQEHSGAEVFNLGISGDTATGILKRFDSEMEARGGDVALIAIGINDAQKTGEQANGYRTEEANFKEVLTQLVTAAKRRDARIGFIGLTRVDETKTRPVLWRNDRHYENERIATFDSIIKEVCEDAEIPYLRVADTLAIDDLPDGLHPNAAGYEKLFSAIAPFIEARLNA